MQIECQEESLKSWSALTVLIAEFVEYLINARNSYIYILNKNILINTKPFRLRWSKFDHFTHPKLFFLKFI